MAGYVGAIEKQTLDNNYFRQVLYTGKYAQLVVMCLQPGEEIGNEVHPEVDQFFRIEQGEAVFVLEGKEKHIVRGKVEKVVTRFEEMQDKYVEERQLESFRVSIKILKQDGEIITLM